MISGQTTNNNSCFPNVSQGLQIYNPLNGREDIVGSSSINEASSSMEISSHSNSLLYSLSLLKDKVNQVQSLVSILVSPAGQTEPESTSSLAIARMGTMIQEIIVTASSMVFTCQQMANHNTDQFHHQAPHHANKVQENVLLQSNFGGNNIEQDRGQSYFSSEAFEWYGDNYNDNNNNNRDLAVISSNNKIEKKELSHHNKESVENIGEEKSVLFKNYDIIELDASDLLAKYTHYCQVCGKGFKRDANLRMHMRAHGDEFKTNAALSNPMKNSSRDGEDESNNWTKLPRKYSCPQEGCRWNKKHAKFQPLKSMICVKNHYKRSHCPKMYVCKRCNRKQFSVLSDLRTHEKHCGDLKWQCSCGTTFSRKDKLVGHVALFTGHTPAINNNNNNTSFTKPAAATKVKNQAIQMQQEDRG